MGWLKEKLIVIGGAITFILSILGYAKYQKYRADKQSEKLQQSEINNKKQLEVLNNYEERRKQEANARMLDDDDINNRLHDNGNLRD